jgi:hypothetical protein
VAEVAQTRIEAMAKAAKVEIESKALEGQRQLATGALRSEEAKAFLATMPTVESLDAGSGRDGDTGAETVETKTPRARFGAAPGPWSTTPYPLEPGSYGRQ